MELKSLAKIGYEAYGRATGNKNFRGEEMPKFDDLPEKIVNAWEAAAQYIVRVHELGKTHEIIQSGWAGTLPSGNIVDRRIFPEAMPIPRNFALGIPQPRS